jgi:hypothetical protein
MRKLSLLSAVCAAVLFSATVSSATSISWVNETDQASEADFASLLTASVLNVNAGATTTDLYGEISEAGKTAAAGANESITAYVGYGDAGSNPLTDTSWVWFAATFDTQAGNNDQYKGQLTAPMVNGTYSYTYRFSVDGGTDFTAADLDGAGSNHLLTFDPSKLGTMTVVNGLSAPVPDRSDSLTLLLMALAAIASQRRRLLSSR